MKLKPIIITVTIILSVVMLNSCKKNYDIFHSKSKWLKDYFSELEKYDDIYAISYWHEDFDNTYLKINSSKKSLKTFKNLISLEEFEVDCEFENRKLIAKVNKKYFASFPDFCGEEDCVSKEKIKNYETLVEKEIAWAYFSNNWNDTIIFPSDNVIEIINAGRIPFIRMMPRSEFEEYRIDPIWNLKEIINGKHDIALRKWFFEAKNINTNLLVEFGTEVNGSWFSWNGKYYGAGTKDGYGDDNYPDGPEIFKDAYRHIIDLSKEMGVENITWFFHFDVNNEPEEWWNKAKLYYPGDDYIDWLGVSTYGVMNKEDKYTDLKPEDLLTKAHDTFIEISKNKPYAILEFGITEL